MPPKTIHAAVTIAIRHISNAACSFYILRHMRRPFTAFSIAIVVAAGIAIRAGHAFSFVDVAEKPMRIALLIDTSAGTSAAMHQVRSSVATFMDALPPAHEVLLVSTGRRVQFRVPP